MLIKRFLLICSLPSFITGCSEFYGSQPPAPIYGGGSIVYSKPKPPLPKPQELKPIVSKPIEQKPVETLKVKPLKEFIPITTPIEIEPEPLTPEQGQRPRASEQKSTAAEQGSAMPGQETSTPEQEASMPEQAAQTTAQEASKPTQASSTTKPTQEPLISVPKPEFLETPPPPPPPPPFEPLETFAPLSPAVNALASAASQNSKSGNIESATTTIERAIRIEPRNATLYYKLALLKLKQSKPRLAEDLAKKAALLASSDTQLKKHSWLLVARAREIQGDLKGGKEARAKASKF